MKHIIWIDIETTGLNPLTDDILEIGVLRSRFEQPFDAEQIYYAELHWEGDRTKLHPIVQAMHEKSGLFGRCAEASHSIYSVTADLCMLVPEESEADDRPVLGGSTVHFDKGFLARDCSSFVERLSHRLYDVSAIKLFCQSLGMPKLPKGEAHTVIDDIRESVHHAKACAEWLSTRERAAIVRWLKPKPDEVDMGTEVLIRSQISSILRGDHLSKQK